MPYASASQVLARTSGFTITASSNPSLGDLDEWLRTTAAELDGILLARGYLLPVPTTATQALELLTAFNVHGAVAMLTAANPVTGGKEKDAMKLWDDCRKMLAAGKVELDAPLDIAEAAGRTGPSQATSRFAVLDGGGC